MFSYVQIGQSSGILSAYSSVTTSPANEGGSVSTITVNRGTTVVVTSFIPNEPTVTIPSPSHNSTNTTTSGNQSDLSNPSERPIMSSNEPSFWNSAGKVAGVFVAVGILIALLGIGLVWFCRNATGRHDEEKSGISTSQVKPRQGSGSQPVSRSASVLQLLGMRERARQDDVPSTSSTANHRLSRTPPELVVPVVDQRLDPQSMMIRFDDNDSSTSFRDEEDYSRRIWRVTNASDSDSLSSDEVASGPDGRTNR